MMPQYLMKKIDGVRSIAAPIDFPLTKRQRRLVDTLVSSGCTIKTAAAKAGYSKGRECESGRSMGSKALRLPHVLAYLLAETSHELSIDAVRARLSIASMSRDARSEYVRLLASKDILDRTGFKPPEQRQVTGELKVSINLGTK